MLERRANFSAIVVCAIHYALAGAAVQHDLGKGGLVSTQIESAHVLRHGGDEIEGSPVRLVMLSPVLVYILGHGWSQRPGAAGAVGATNVVSSRRKMSLQVLWASA